MKYWNAFTSKIYPRLRTNPLWIIAVLIAAYFYGVGYLCYPWDSAMLAVRDKVSEPFFFIMVFYTYTVIAVFVVFLLSWLIKPNRYIWKSFLLPKKGAVTDESDVLAEFYGRNHNGFKMLAFGLLIGLLTNGLAISFAMLHGDVSLHFEASVGQIPILLFAFFSVLIQSSSEEMWFNGFLFERFNERYPIWVVALINGALFGGMHMFNDGASFLSCASIAVGGVSYALLRWYSGSIWTVMGVHAGWNYMQNFICGLPNSGIESVVSFFSLDEASGVTSLFYDSVFGVECGFGSMLTDFSLGVIVLIFAARKGRLKELKMKQVRP